MLQYVGHEIKKHRYYQSELTGNCKKANDQGKEIGSLAQITYCVAGNAGDTVLSQCVRKTWMTQFRVKGWDLYSVKAKVTDDTIAGINRNKGLIIGGGGLFLPDTNKNDISGWQWAISSEQLNRIKVPVFVYSVGYNYFPGQKPQKLFCDNLKRLAEKSSFFGLRNQGSVNAVRELLPEEIREKVVFQPCTTTLARKLLGCSIPSHKKTGNVALNIAFDRAERRFGDDKEVILSNVAKAAKKIEERGYRIIYVCHLIKDDQFIPYLKREGVKYRLEDLSCRYPDYIYQFYNQIDLVMGMRGHAQMIPFGMNCEIISLGTHDKMKWFLEDIHATDWYVDMRENPDCLADRIIEKFVKIHEENNEETKKKLAESQEALWKITENNLADIQKILLNE